MNPYKYWVLKDPNHICFKYFLAHHTSSYDCVKADVPHISVPCCGKEGSELK